MWFSASLLFKSIHDPPSNAEAVWEERIMLISADSENEAQNLASELGAREHVSYKNVYDEQVTWQFDSVQSVHELVGEMIEHGTELFSRFLKENEVESLKRKFSD